MYHKTRTPVRLPSGTSVLVGCVHVSFKFIPGGWLETREMADQPSTAGKRQPTPLSHRRYYPPAPKRSFFLAPTAALSKPHSANDAAPSQHAPPNQGAGSGEGVASLPIQDSQRSLSTRELC